MRPRFAEHIDHAGQHGVHACTHIQVRGREPDAIDADHCSSSRSQAEHCAAADIGQVTVIDEPDPCSSTRMSEDDAAAFIGT